MKSTIKTSLSLVAVLTGSIAITFLLKSMKSAPERKPLEDTSMFVETLEIVNTNIQIEVPVMGKITAQEKVSLFAEVPGIMLESETDFLAGYGFKKNDILLRINSDESVLNLKAQRSKLMTAVAALLPELKFDYPQSYANWESYLQAFDINSDTKPFPEALNERERYFVANKGIAGTYYSIKSAETHLEKYTIRAPFDGTVTESYIKPGNLIRNGQTLGVFLNPDKYDLEVSVGIDEIEQIALADKVILKSAYSENSWTGVVSRISDGLDASSQMVKVYITISGSGLREGMFLTGDILTTSALNGVILPRKMLESNDTVLEVQDGIINRLAVNVVYTRGEEAMVTGIADGTIISLKTQNLKNGTVVRTLENGSNNAPQKPDSVG
ncbi:MAG: HlyD family efflux transporter periplasmic adaptor subunit [Candidatus Marinimicrobia bacterium]|nr:HlyD family efflux transporter periplasmic adaptor subunit [Candidatus Neomarinimicrobiota bacterium]MBT4713985.1 HlyD family efflux transporter periplasmic adaptor subunit [Candidatus Neomarinimicrobiota bacterium]MBT4947059.1 HlyD family efflux transporter periplasmic adaptor subunit [Candidatus Neomarinimicrobiota bacterium]MBT5268443.1 HlyD family efflux transporter periplasmic adaptor subunit [Candidatus Neomarinimicrobiota bacterium]MBT6012825.1 HlyD family efflux transporter periplasm